MLRLGEEKKDKSKEEERKILWQKIKKGREIEQMQQEEERKRFEQEKKKREAERLEKERLERIKQRKENLKKEKAKQRRENKEKLAEETFEKSQREKGLELFDGKWVDKKEIPKLKEIQIGLDKNFQNLSPYNFEKFIAKLFKAMGYETRVTQASNDYGIDVVAEKGNEKIAIQCKRYRPGNPVSNRDIQRLLGAMQLKSIRGNPFNYNYYFTFHGSGKRTGKGMCD